MNELCYEVTAAHGADIKIYINRQEFLMKQVFGESLTNQKLKSDIRLTFLYLK